MTAAAFTLLASASVTLIAHDITTRVTWDRDIGRIVQARCVSCHRAGGAGPMALETYEQARPWAKAIRDEVLTRRMPKWHAARGYGDFANDPSLSPFEIALVSAWAEGGAPKSLPAGTPAMAAITPAPAPRREPSATRIVELACGERSVAGRLLAIRPRLNDGGTVSVSVRRPDGSQEILAWIRGYESAFASTYWLRTPLDLPPGSTMAARADGPCAMTLTLAR